MEALQAALAEHSRPVTVAFDIYEMLSAAGYTDEEIVEVASALEDIVS